MFDDSHAMVPSNDGGWQKGQLSNPILSELGWLDIGHRETKRETAPAPEKLGGGKPWKFGDAPRTWRLSHHVWLSTSTFSGCFFFFNSGSQISRSSCEFTPPGRP